MTVGAGRRGAVALVPAGSLSHYLSLSDSVSLNYSDKSKDLKVFLFLSKKCCYLKPAVLSCRDKSRQKVGKKSHITLATDQQTGRWYSSLTQMVFLSLSVISSHRFVHYFSPLICLYHLIICFDSCPYRQMCTKSVIQYEKNIALIMELRIRMHHIVFKMVLTSHCIWPAE